VGSGIVSSGNVLRGANGFGGELGHLTVVPGGRVCGCGGLGCLETYASVTALIRTVINGVLNKSSGSGDFDAALLERDPEAAGPILSASALAGNPLALGAYRLAGESLGNAFAQLTTLLAPECFILSGGMLAAGDLFLAPLRERFALNAARFHKPLPRIVLSGLGSGDAALLGAASLCFS
jgi:glucokinase